MRAFRDFIAPPSNAGVKLPKSSNIRSYIIYEIREATPDFIAKSGSLRCKFSNFF